MFEYGKTSRQRLNTCNQDLITLFDEVAIDINTSILCGYRSEVEQNKAFDIGTSEKRFPDSEHNTYPSMAVDAAPYFPEIKNTDWEDSAAFALFAGHVLATAKRLYKAGRITHQVIWGGDWNSNGRCLDHHFKDYPHFQLTKENVWNL